MKILWATDIDGFDLRVMEGVYEKWEELTGYDLSTKKVRRIYMRDVRLALSPHGIPHVTGLRCNRDGSIAHIENGSKTENIPAKDVTRKPMLFISNLQTGDEYLISRDRFMATEGVTFH